MSSTHSAAFDPVDRAISRVLAAERAATDDVATAERGAAERLEQARESARRVSEAATRRIARIREAFAACTAAAVAARDEQAAAIPDPEITAEAASDLRTAVARLADELTGAR